MQSGQLFSHGVHTTLRVFCSPVLPSLLPASEHFPAPWCFGLWLGEGVPYMAGILQHRSCFGLTSMACALHFQYSVSVRHCRWSWLLHLSEEAQGLAGFAADIESVIWESRWRSKVFWLRFCAADGVTVDELAYCSDGRRTGRASFFRSQKTSSSAIPSLLLRLSMSCCSRSWWSCQWVTDIFVTDSIVSQCRLGEGRVSPSAGRVSQ